MNIFIGCILLFLSACDLTLSPERIAVIYMKSRYFDPPYAYKMLKPGQISKEDFLLKHEEMLRIKDYNLQTVISFKVISSKKINEKSKAVTVETTRPDLKKIFSGFYQEKLVNNWSRGQIKEQMSFRLKDINAPEEKLIDEIFLEKTSHGWRILLKKPN